MLYSMNGIQFCNIFIEFIIFHLIVSNLLCGITLIGHKHDILLD